MKKMMVALAFAGLMTSGVYSQNRLPSFAELLTREVPAGCEIPCKGPVCVEQQCVQGYVFAYGGGSFLADDMNVFFFPGPLGQNVDFGSGFIMGGGVGVRNNSFGGIRLEIEGLYSELPASSFTGAGGGGAVAGDVSFTATFINVVKELPLACMPCLTPYAGIGFGFANVDFDFNGVAGPNFSDSDHALAAQLILGADYNLCNNIALFTQYKLVRVDETDYGFIGGPNTTIPDFWTHNVVAGIRFTF